MPPVHGTSIPEPTGTGSKGNRSPYVVFGKTYEVLPDSLGYREIGIASWYGKEFHGRLTSNGERFDMYKLSAAHKALPIPTVVKVTNLDNGKSIIVRVNDRGPFHEDRIIDLSYQAAFKLGFSDKGTAPVVVEALDDLNYPGHSRQAVGPNQFFLQVGAFAALDGAESRREEMKLLMRENEMEGLDVRIFQSDTEQVILHKVWLGPLGHTDQSDRIIQLVKGASFGKVFRVRIN